LKNEAGNEYTSIVFDNELNRIGINRFLSSPYNTAKDYKTVDYTYTDTLYVRIFIDHSILEVFINNEIVMSSRVYPGPDSKSIDLISSNGQVEIISFKAWDIINKEEIITPKFCHNITKVESISSNKIIKVFPNPSNENLFMIYCPDFDQMSKESLILLNRDGISIPYQIEQYHQDTFQIKVLDNNISDFIIGNIKINHKIETFKVVLIK
jgi:hypothetical protein